MNYIIITILIILAFMETCDAGWTGWTPWSTGKDATNSLSRSRIHLDKYCKACYDRYTDQMDRKPERLVNVALNQPAVLSSTYKDFTADLVIDGVTNTDMEFGSCCQSKMESSPWLRVDLMKDGLVTFVEEVVIYNRYDCCSSRANNLTVTIGDNPDGGNNKQCYTISSMNAEVVRLVCNEIAFGRYLHIRIPGPQILHLCEVQALGGRYKNHALNAHAEAWPIDGRYPAERLVDGKLDSYAETSVGGANPWFRIDLGKEVMVSMVHVYMGRKIDYIQNSIVSVGTYQGRGTLEICNHISERIKIKRGTMYSYVAKCGHGGIKGRIVQISMVAKSQYLSSSEVQVLGDV